MELGKSGFNLAQIVGLRSRLDAGIGECLYSCKPLRLEGSDNDARDHPGLSLSYLVGVKALEELDGFG